MRKALLFLAFSLAAFGAQAEKKFTVVETPSTTSSISPNGRYVVGNDPTMYTYGNDIMSGFRSYLLDTETGAINWMTLVDGADLSKTGYFTDVNDEKTIVGYFKNPDYKITVSDFDGVFTLPINVAAIWKNGTMTSLGIGNFGLAAFNSFNDGSFATAVSADSKFVVGFIARGNSAVSTPCAWKYNSVTARWDYMTFKLPQTATGGQVLSVSADGSIAVGQVDFSERSVAAYWDAQGNCTIIEGVKTADADDTAYNTPYNFGKATKISSNGLYIVFQFNSKIPALYLTKENRYIKIGDYADANSVELASVSDNGDVIGQYNYGNFFLGTYTRPFWYSYKAKKNLGFDYFVSLYASGIDIPYTFSFESREKNEMKAISANGKSVIGNDVENGWVLQSENSGMDIPRSVTNVKAVSLALKEVTVTWDKVESTKDWQLLSYNIYCDGEAIANVDANSTSYTHNNTATGFLKYSVSGVYSGSNGGNQVESPRDEIVEVCVPDTYDLPFFDDFNSGALTTNYWTQVDYTVNSEPIRWGCPMFTGLDQTNGLYGGVFFENEEYSSALISRPMDATGQDRVYVSYAIIYRFLNTGDWVKTDDFLAIEVSTDNQNWTPVKIHRVDDDSRASKWEFEQLDISEYVAGQLFRVRIHKYGKALAPVNWNMDNFRVGIRTEQTAPEGLTGQLKGNKVNLIWKNSIGAYELNYLRSPLAEEVFYLTLGNEGKPLIAVNAFDAADLDLYKDKYITSVTTYINFDYNIENSKETRASIVVYENDVLIRDQEIKNLIYNDYCIGVLDSPVKVDGTKNIKVGIKITDYDARQIPISYQNTRGFIAGKSDLYSVDNGKTWSKLSDHYANIPGSEYEGYCCWDITANVTDESTVGQMPERDRNLLAYNVMRNGEKINPQSIHFSPTQFTDENPVDNACYEVVAFYLDGTVSDASAQYCIGSLTSIEDPFGEVQIGIYPNPASDFVNISGEFDRVSLTDTDGRVLKKTTENVLPLNGLAPGIYILKIEKGQSAVTKKLIVKQ